jgi:hypothetical protein
MLFVRIMALNLFVMSPSKKRWYIVLLMMVGLSVCPWVDHMISADYLKKKKA